MVNTLGILTAIVLAFSAFVALKNKELFEKAVSDTAKQAIDKETNTNTYNGLLEEIKSVMESRKTRIDELRSEIEQIEQQNSDLETTIADILSSFDDK